MYSKKYRLQSIETANENPIHGEILGKVCYLAYFKVGERGWFLCDTEASSDRHVHRIHTSEVKVVEYHTRSHRVIVYTENTKYVFGVVSDGE